MTKEDMIIYIYKYFQDRNNNCYSIIINYVKYELIRWNTIIYIDLLDEWKSLYMYLKRFDEDVLEKIIFDYIL